MAPPTKAQKVQIRLVQSYPIDYLERKKNPGAQRVCSSAALNTGCVLCAGQVSLFVKVFVWCFLLEVSGEAREFAQRLERIVAIRRADELTVIEHTKANSMVCGGGLRRMRAKYFD